MRLSRGRLDWDSEAAMTKVEIPDGLDVLRRELGLREIMQLIERTARWVAPESFRYLPVWYPEHARRAHFYKRNWSEPQMNTNRVTKTSSHKFEGNTHANKALTLALGLRSDDRPNWSCCHIWGLDDPSYQQSNAIVQDRRYFSCVGNMVLLPAPLKAFTDVMPEVKLMLRVCAAHFYNWVCEHESVLSLALEVKQWSDWQVYPQSWPRDGMLSLPLGTLPFSASIQASADNRLCSIRSDLENAGEFYPRKEVLDALEYWKVKI
jgi:hypothetical protein